MRVLLTGGAGFIGTNLAMNFKSKYSSAEVVCFDNLSRRGSEKNLKLLLSHGIEFIHGDIRVIEDFVDIQGEYDLFIDASADPSVLTGIYGDAGKVIGNNLTGTINCLKFAKEYAKLFIFLSTSRVYSIDHLRAIPLITNNERFEVDQAKQSILGLASGAIREDFSTRSFRSFYGSCKLASELLIEEYAHIYGLDAIINRCGVLSGEGQWGKTDQGVFTYWVAKHFYKRPLSYTGFGGNGYQVRDLLHPDDLFVLIDKQAKQKLDTKAPVYNVGGGPSRSVSLQEFTQLCQTITGNKVDIKSIEQTNPVDIPYFVTCSDKVSNDYSWTPTITAEQIVSRIYLWIRNNEKDLKTLFG
ncbi:NAD-dependent epimerase/dehydratase family protein [Patescibacteria group bacterium]|nr:NAD-dependent epimerase/dehydratase family protein [Patescibacteria group bacterium]